MLARVLVKVQVLVIAADDDPVVVGDKGSLSQSW